MSDMRDTVPTLGAEETANAHTSAPGENRHTHSPMCTRCAARAARPPAERRLVDAMEDFLDSFRAVPRQPSSTPGLISVPKAARMVGRTSRTLKRWINEGLLKPHRIRGHWYVDSQEFHAFIAKTDGKRRRSTLRVA